MRIAQYEIGPSFPVFLQSEVGVTHNGEMKKAFALIDASAEAGLDACKFILTDPEKIGAWEAEFTYETAAGTRKAPIGDLLKRTVLTPEEWREIRDHCREREIIFYATTDYLEGVDLLEALDVPAHKLSAWDIAYLPLIRKMSETGKPLLIDVGTATMDEWRSMRAVGGQFFPLLAPHPHGAMDWNFRRHGHFPWGFSSPGRDTWCDFLALGRGACVIEKRLTLDRSELEGHHHYISLNPEEMSRWVRQIREAEMALREEAWAGTPQAWEERHRWDRDPHGLRYG